MTLLKGLSQRMSLRINDIKINWTNSKSHYFFNPKHPKAQKTKSPCKKASFFSQGIFIFLPPIREKSVSYLKRLSSVQQKPSTNTFKWKKPIPGSSLYPCFMWRGFRFWPAVFAEDFPTKKALIYGIQRPF